MPSLLEYTFCLIYNLFWNSLSIIVNKFYREIYILCHGKSILFHYFRSRASACGSCGRDPCDTAAANSAAPSPGQPATAGSNLGGKGSYHRGVQLATNDRGCPGKAGQSHQWQANTEISGKWIIISRATCKKCKLAVQNFCTKPRIYALICSC